MLVPFRPSRFSLARAEQASGGGEDSEPMAAMAPKGREIALDDRSSNARGSDRSLGEQRHHGRGSQRGHGRDGGRAAVSDFERDDQEDSETEEDVEARFLRNAPVRNGRRRKAAAAAAAATAVAASETPARRQASERVRTAAWPAPCPSCQSLRALSQCARLSLSLFGCSQSAPCPPQDASSEPSSKAARHTPCRNRRGSAGVGDDEVFDDDGKEAEQGKCRSREASTGAEDKEDATWCAAQHPPISSRSLICVKH